MSIFESWKTYQRWCAAITGDYEVLIHEFLICSEWDYMTFKKLAQKVGTVYMHQCALGRGKKMDVHFERITGILIEQAKDFWLLHPMKEVREDFFNHDAIKTASSLPESRLKAMMAGFYLTFTMFKTIPGSIRKIKILMDIRDLYCLKYFQLCIANSKVSKFVKLIVQAMMFDLSLDGAFRLCAESHMVGIDPSIRHYRNIVDGELTKINVEAKLIKDDFVVPTVSESISKELADLQKQISVLKNKALLCSHAVPLVDEVVQDHLNVDRGNTSVSSERYNSTCLTSEGARLLPIMPENAPPERSQSQDNSLAVVPVPDKPRVRLFYPSLEKEIVRAMGRCAVLSDVPVLSLPNILGNVVVDRVMIKEARIRRERLMAKRNGGRALKARNSKPYMEEGGIFGRKKGIDDDVAANSSQVVTSQQTSNSSTGNLWNYIHTGSFNGVAPAPVLALPCPPAAGPVSSSSKKKK